MYICEFVLRSHERIAETCVMRELIGPIFGTFMRAYVSAKCAARNSFSFPFPSKVAVWIPRRNWILVRSGIDRGIFYCNLETAVYMPRIIPNTGGTRLPSRKLETVFISKKEGLSIFGTFQSRLGRQ